MNNRDREADIIKVAALLTAAPRWAGALLEADGVPALAAWAGWWRVAALLLSLGMAAVEGFAIAYVFNAWRRERANGTSLLLWLAILALADFGIILAPYVAANVSGVPLRAVLGSGPLLWLWSIAVAASTGIVVASVGYAQRSSDPASGTSEPKREHKAKGEPASDEASDGYVCDFPGCGRSFGSQQALNAHSGAHKAPALGGRDKATAANGREPEAEPQTPSPAARGGVAEE